ncbi:BLUF domain-containing protein [Sphingomonas mucosissima]|uniref:Sensors of blue-light using FAD n=1 Tax=Sphingomonas mucosissima TaxID=370959 RepID=A0A245ZS98_9SPHN|nr:BLUF domain-containing protein [Sphingomonas mucosissima]OWK32618.1 sensors of blue-light using FAD [Sphingomonas mucosissima]
MRQLLYISTATPGAAIDISGILATSLRNNRRDGVTGLLWTDERRFLQALEGSEDAIQSALLRIKFDTRHRGIVVLQDRAIAIREFGAWEMARRGPADTADAFDGRMRQYLSGASPSVRGTFEGLIAARRAA